MPDEILLDFFVKKWNEWLAASKVLDHIMAYLVWHFIDVIIYYNFLLFLMLKQLWRLFKLYVAQSVITIDNIWNW